MNSVSRRCIRIEGANSDSGHLTRHARQKYDQNEDREDLCEVPEDRHQGGKPQERWKGGIDAGYDKVRCRYADICRL